MVGDQEGKRKETHHAQLVQDVLANTLVLEIDP